MLERGGVERFAVVAGEAELHRVQSPVGHAEAEPLDHERRIRGLEPVPLALTEGEPAVIRSALEGEQEEAQGRRIDDLGAVVEHATLGIHAIGVLTHAWTL